jgi:hypothetical protein
MRHPVAFALVLVLGAASTVFADVKPGDKKEEKAPDAQGTGRDMPKGPLEKMKNPLPGIVEQMKNVEKRLAETETGSWSQEEQQRIVDALKIEGDVIDALQKLIEEVENQPPQGGGGGGDQQMKERQRQQSKSQQQRSQKERQSEGQEKPADMQKKPGEKEQQQQDEARNNEKKEGDPGRNDYRLDRQSNPNAGDSWGHLPVKARQAVIDARRAEPPPQWRKQIEDYFRTLAEPRK